MILVENRQLLFSNREQYLGTPYDNGTTNRVFRIDRINEDGKDLSNLTFNIDLIYIKDLSTDTALLEKTVDRRYIYLTWLVGELVSPKEGAIKINLRAKDDSGLVKWSSYQEIVYFEPTGSPITPSESDLTELEQLESKISGLYDSVTASESERQAAEEERQEAEEQREADFNTAIEEFNESKQELINYSALSKSYANGQSGIREGEETDNSYYYMNQSKSYSEAAEDSATDAESAKTAAESAQAAAEQAAEEAAAAAGVEIDGVTIKRNSDQELYADSAEIVKVDNSTIGKTDEGKLKLLAKAADIFGIDKYGVTGEDPVPGGTGTAEAALQSFLDIMGDALINDTRFIEKFKTRLINGATANAEGYALDARQGNPDIAGSLALLVKAQGAMTSDAFSEEVPYAVGDYAIYDNKLYKFTAAKEAGAWDETKVEATTVAGELSVLNSSVETLTLNALTNHGSNPLDCNEMKQGAYYLGNSNYQNMPPENGGFLLAFGQSTSRFAQLFISITGAFYIRRNTGDMSDWTKI